LEFFLLQGESYADQRETREEEEEAMGSEGHDRLDASRKVSPKGVASGIANADLISSIERVEALAPTGGRRSKKPKPHPQSATNEPRNPRVERIGPKALGCESEPGFNGPEQGRPSAYKFSGSHRRTPAILEVDARFQ
jgi:hypothetical protein